MPYKKFSAFLSISLLSVVLINLSTASTINVPTDQPTIAAAISIASSGDTILINPGTYVNDTIAIIDKSLTVMGNGGQAIVTLAKSTTEYTVTDVSAGVLVTMSTANPNTSMNVTLQNLTILPAKEDTSSTRANKGVLFNTPNVGFGTTLNVNMQNCLVTANDSTDNPVSTSGLSFVDVSTAIRFRDDAIYIRGNINANFTGVIVTNNRPTGSAGASGTPDGFVLVPTANDSYTTNFNGCIVSFNDRMGLQIAAAGNIYNVVGTPTTRNLFLSNGYSSIVDADLTSFSGAGSGGTTGGLSIEYTDIISRSATSVLMSSGIIGMPISVSNCRIVSSNTTLTKNGIELDDSAYGQTTIANCTFYSRFSTDNGINIGGATNTTALVISNCIFSSESTIGGRGINAVSTTSHIDISFTSLVTTGLNTLSFITSGGGAFTIDTGVIYDDPLFQSEDINDLLLSVSPASFSGFNDMDTTFTAIGGKFLNVTDTTYSLAASDGSALKGGAGFVTNGVYLTWTSSSTNIASLIVAADDTAEFTLGVSTGNVIITATDVDGQIFNIFGSVALSTVAVDTVTITSSPNGSPNPVSSLGSVFCTATASSSLAYPLTYVWSAPTGSFDNASSQSPTWMAPLNSSLTTQHYSISVLASDEFGNSDSQNYDQQVSPIVEVDLWWEY